jgi:glycosyltransferase involved in cell wall biosynthesis
MARVLFVVHGWPPHHNAGSEWMAHTMARALVAAGHDVTAALLRPTYGPSTPWELDGVRVVPIPERGRGTFDVRGLVRDHHVVVTHLDWTTRATLLGRVFGRPVVHLLHNDRADTRGGWRAARPRSRCSTASGWSTQSRCPRARRVWCAGPR